MFGNPILNVIFIGIVVFVVLCIVFKKGFLIPLIGGMPIFIFGLYYFVDALDHLNGFVNWASGQITGDYDRYLSQKNDALIFMVIGGILILLGIIFAIKNGNNKNSNVYTNNHYEASSGSAFMCQSCGKIIPAGTKFCPHCGAPVNTVPAGQFNPNFGTQAKNTENTKPEIKSEPKVNKNVCPNCGAKRSASEKFCGKCGAKFE